MSWVDARKVPVLLALATLIPISALSWLGTRTLQQDRELERQRRRERLEVAAGRVALDIERHLQNIEERLAAGNGIRLTASGIESSQEFPILYQPGSVGLTPTATSPLLVAAEVEEFQRHDGTAAAQIYRQISRSAEPGTRAAALLGLGRVLRQRGDHESAITAYEDLAALGSVMVAGQPAALVGRQGRCKLFEANGDQRALLEGCGRPRRDAVLGPLVDRSLHVRAVPRDGGALGRAARHGRFAGRKCGPSRISYQGRNSPARIAAAGCGAGARRPLTSRKKLSLLHCVLTVVCCRPEHWQAG